MIILRELIYRLTNREESIKYFKLAAEIKKDIEDSTGFASSLNNIGFVFWRSSQFDSAIVYFEQALEIRQTLTNKEHIASTSNSMGTIYYQWAMYDKALEYYLQSLSLNKEIDNKKGIALALTNIGLIYNETSQNLMAIEYYKESLRNAASIKDTQTIAYIYHCFGSAYVNTLPDSAFYYYNQSYDHYKAVNYIGGEVYALKSIGEYYLNSGQLDSAKSYFNIIMKLAAENDIPLRVAEAYKNLAEIYKKEGKLESAKEFFKKSISMSETQNIKVFLRDSYFSISEIYETTHEFKDALDALKKYEKIRREIEDDGMQRRVADLKNTFEMQEYQRDLQAQMYENEIQKMYLIFSFFGLLLLITIVTILHLHNRKAKKVNALLSQQNELIEGQSFELNKKNNELVELNLSKDKLFSIIAHDLKNPFFALISFSSLLKEEYDKLNDSEKQEYISYIEMTSKKTYQLLDNLLSLSASRTGKIEFNQVKIQLADLTNNVIDLFESQLQNKQIDVSNKIDENILIYADAYMFETVMRNLINNAIKYSNRNGNIEISAVEYEQETHIVIKDDGIGIAPKFQENIFNINFAHSKLGTDGEKGTGLGLGLCKEFIEKNGGKILVESELGKGSKFHIYLPKSLVENNLIPA